MGGGGTCTYDGEVGIFLCGEAAGRFSCPECGKESHLQIQHSVENGRSRQEVNEESGGDNTRTYRMAFIVKAGPRPFTVEGCSGRVMILTAMRVHFWNWNGRDTAVIL